MPSLKFRGVGGQELEALEASPNHQRAGYHGAIGLTKKAEYYTDAATHGIAKLSAPAELSTSAIKAGERAASAAKSAVETLRNPAKAQDPSD